MWTPGGAFASPYPRADGSSGTTWSARQTPGHSPPIEKFFVAKPTDSIESINNALSQGKNLISPGRLRRRQDDQGEAADRSCAGWDGDSHRRHGNMPMTVADVDVSYRRPDHRRGPGHLAGALQVGHPARLERPGYGHGRGNDPTAIQECLPDGGPHIGKASVSLEVDRDNTILDDISAWRADHGNGVGWTSNNGETGVVVNGDDVVDSGLSPEHFQKYDVNWAARTARRSCSRTRCRTTSEPGLRGSTTGARLRRLQGGAPRENPRGVGARELLLLQREPLDPREQPAFESRSHRG